MTNREVLQALLLSPPTPGYREMIVEMTDCPASEAGAIEQLMRDTYGTLDGLSRESFKREAKLCLRTIKYLRENAAEEVADAP